MYIVQVPRYGSKCHETMLAPRTDLPKSAEDEWTVDICPVMLISLRAISKHNISGFFSRYFEQFTYVAMTKVG